jgi:hypothetical protein
MNITPIARIYVIGSRRDFHLTRICVASIRYWYPEIPITLISDFEVGEFDSSALARDWNVGRYESTERRFGWGFSKLEALFTPERERYLALDSDIVLLGPVLDLLNETPGDFVVHPEVKERAKVEEYFFALEPLAAFDPSFVVPPSVFNCGQYVGTSGLLEREDFHSVLEWSSPRRALHPEIFKCADQGLFNYILVKAEAQGRLTVGRRKFFSWRGHGIEEITVDRIVERTSPPFLVHWAGPKSDDIRLLERPDILAFYDAYNRGRRSLRGRLAYGLRYQAARKWSRRFRLLLWRSKCWLAGKPYAAGGNMADLNMRELENFHDPERSSGINWCWTEPVAGIKLPIKRDDYRVRIETGSPQPMRQLVDSNLQFFINQKPVSGERIKITEGVAEVDLDADWLAPEQPQVLGWTMNQMPTSENESRTLGMPVTAIWIFRRHR